MQQILENSSHQRFDDKEENFKLDLAEDALNRDFRMNALYFDLEELKIMDPLGSGLEDIQNKMVELCSELAFCNDPLRILRAVRMSTQFNFKISNQIQDQIKVELM
jgi:tRNA nucleotidyltransferase (CCA-adding enzyme)